MKFLFQTFAILILLFLGVSAKAAKDSCQTFAPRTEIVDPNNQVKHPYKLICHVTTNRKKKFWFGGKTDYSTFMLLSPRVLIGAGHSIRQAASKIRSIDIDIYAHQENGKEVVLQTVHLERNEFDMKRPFNGDGRENDCSVIIFNKPLTGSFGAFPVLITPSDAQQLSSSCKLSGYPYDQGDVEYTGKRLWERTIFFDKTFVSNGSLLHYPCVKTSVGDSGGPLWLINGGTLYLLATHVGGHRIDYNDIWAECFTKEKIDILNNIVSTNK